MSKRNFFELSVQDFLNETLPIFDLAYKKITEEEIRELCTQANSLDDLEEAQRMNKKNIRGLEDSVIFIYLRLIVFWQQFDLSNVQKITEILRQLDYDRDDLNLSSEAIYKITCCVSFGTSALEHATNQPKNSLANILNEPPGVDTEKVSNSLTCLHKICENYQAQLENDLVNDRFVDKKSIAVTEKKIETLKNLKASLCINRSDKVGIRENERLQRFNDLFFDPQTQAAFAAHRDKRTTRFFVNTFFILTFPLIFGAVIAYKTKGSLKFWQSNGESIHISLSRQLVAAGLYEKPGAAAKSSQGIELNTLDINSMWNPLLTT